MYSPGHTGFGLRIIGNTGMAKKTSKVTKVQEEKEDYITLREAAKILEVYHLTVANWFDRGIIKGKKTMLGARKPLRSSVMQIRKRLEEGWRMRDFKEGE